MGNGNHLNTLHGRLSAVDAEQQRLREELHPLRLDVGFERGPSVAAVLPGGRRGRREGVRNFDVEGSVDAEVRLSGRGSLHQEQLNHPARRLERRKTAEEAFHLPEGADLLGNYTDAVRRHVERSLLRYDGPEGLFDRITVPPAHLHHHHRPVLRHQLAQIE